MSKYIDTPLTISFDEIQANSFSLSAPQYKKLLISNSNYLEVRDFLVRELERSDLGVEVGSLSYIDKSPKYFLRTKALQKYSFLPEINSETAKRILPKVFQQMNLSDGDIIISKDSNIGEIIILDKDYPDYMLSSALYKLPVNEETKYYLLAFVKHAIFREQLDFIVPSGATIRHAKTMFLDCKIPIPTKKKEKIMQYVSFLTKSIINKEKAIKEKHKNILAKIETELLNNQQNKKANYSFPKYNDIDKNNRIDAGFYSYELYNLLFPVFNYTNGYKSLDNQGLELFPGPSLELRLIGTRVDSDTFRKGFYRLLTPKQILNQGIAKYFEFIGTPAVIKPIQKGDILFGESGTGRTMVYLDNDMNTINNAHAHILRPIPNECTVEKAITIRSILQYYKEIGVTDYLTVGGSGGHLSPSYFDRIYIPNFDKNIQKVIAKLYHNPKTDFEKVNSSNLENFIELDNEFNAEAGIYELDKSAKKYKVRLDEVIDKIANDEEINIGFNLIEIENE
jgi:type I restriction enzyme S subunit